MPEHERPVGQVCHPQRTASARQLSEHVEVGKGQTRLPLEIGLELAQERGMGAQQCGPGRQSPPARRGIRQQAVEVSGDVGFRYYLHMQPIVGMVVADATISEI
jgi:hypothetical protein